MDVNLTGQIAGIPVSLTGQITSESTLRILDWLPILVVIIGGLITYFVTSTIEERKRHFELKKQVYFEFIDQITKAKRLDAELRRLEQLPSDIGRDLAINRQHALITDMRPDFDAAKLKVQVCGSDKVKILIHDLTLVVDDNLHNSVKDTIREELVSTKTWWQFWKQAPYSSQNS
jgi:hypothetical protein